MLISILPSLIAQIPPERAASDYSEKMLYLQPTYQISFESESLRRVVQELSGDRQTARTLLRHSLGIPPHAVLLCNFNKMDKIDPISIQLWMQVNIVMQLKSVVT